MYHYKTITEQAAPPRLHSLQELHRWELKLTEELGKLEVMAAVEVPAAEQRLALLRAIEARRRLSERLQEVLGALVANNDRMSEALAVMSEDLDNIDFVDPTPDGGQEDVG